MKHKMMAYLLLVLLATFAIGVAAQHSEHPPAQTTPTAAAKSEPSKPSEMAARHQEMEKLIDYLSHSLAAMELETDPAAMKSKLANHRSLLEQLQTKVQQCSGMMQKMSDHMEKCPMMRSERKPN